MILSHYTKSPMQFDPRYQYKKLDFRSKPSGLWVSVGGEDGWLAWCKRENFGLERLANRYIVNLKPHAKTLVLHNKDFDTFRYTYGIADHEFYFHNIYWHKVASDYQGIIIPKYHWDMRFEHDWYYSWDCASGCIWDMSAIESIVHDSNYLL